LYLSCGSGHRRNEIEVIRHKPVLTTLNEFSTEVERIVFAAESECRRMQIIAPLFSSVTCRNRFHAFFPLAPIAHDPVKAAGVSFEIKSQFAQASADYFFL
jgi:hypothetical protein